MPFGYNGKILKVNLTEKKVEIEEPDEYFYRTYMGGSCLGAYYLLKEMAPGTDPFSPESIIVFAGSVVTGAPAAGFARSGIIFKSPLTGAIADTQAAGYFGPELKFAGFDAIVIRGKSEKPVYLWVHDEKAEIRDASHLWGKTTGEAQEAIRKELGDDRIICALIGPAGENLVRYACVVNNLKHAWGRLGAGAVMGSKNLKAIAVRGHKKIELKDKETFLSLARHFSSKFMEESPDNRGLHDFGTAQYVIPQNEDGQLPTRNFQTGYFEEAENLSGQKMAQTILLKNEACYACPVRCKRVVKADTPYEVDPEYGGPEYETICMLGSDCGVGDLVAVCKANELCNKFGLDTISTGANIAFAMECYEKGILTKEDTGGIDLKFGNADALLKMVEMIAKREGLGDILAEGVKRASQKIGKGSEKFALHVKGEEWPAHEPRVKGHLALMYTLSPMGADHVQAEHDGAFTPGADPFFAERVKPLGILEPLELSSIDHKKVRRFFYFQSVFGIMDTLTLCLFAFAPVRYFTLPELVQLVKAVTGWETSLWELMKVGERKVAMFKAFNAREGFTKKDDWLPDRAFEGLLSGPRKGQKLDREKLKEAVDLYYQMAGWNEDGVPTKGRLAELDLWWVAEELEKCGKYKK
ncbi:aldehyde ferredoxin oxidoreductase family protein [Candidatus Aerophobetes bacterium]|nr:aldehyde ferredoxin oxidoreductase family protein [Candidatus Aerophobetes bacterium]